MNISVSVTTGTSTAAVVTGLPTSANTGGPAPVSAATAPTPEQIQDALYGYLQGMRALGRTTVDPTEAARALQVDVAAVIQAAQALKSKGVQVK